MDSPAARDHWAWLNRTLPSTQWSLIRRLQHSRLRDGNRSADEFCRYYWYPLYAYLRYKGYAKEDAEDHVQSFMARVLQEDILAKADEAKGRLRNYLLTLLTRHVAARRKRDEAQKRGGAARHLPLDWEAAESLFRQQGLTAGSPEEAFRRALSTRLVAEGIAALHVHYEQSGRLSLFKELLPALEGALADDTYATMAARLGMRPNAVRTASVRMRERFRQHVMASASVVLGMPNDALLEAELQDLFCSPSQPTTL